VSVTYLVLRGGRSHIDWPCTENRSYENPVPVAVVVTCWSVAMGPHVRVLVHVRFMVNKVSF